MATSTLTIDGASLEIHQVGLVAVTDTQVELAPAARQRLLEGAKKVSELSQSGRPVYGVNTGFGVFADRRIGPEQSAELSVNLVRSHAAATGPPFPEAVVRAAMLIRANTLAAGFSGVRPELVERLLALLNHGISPIVPSQGSLGSSGDLAPLAHLALALIQTEDDPGASQVTYQGRVQPAPQARAQAGLETLALGPKEGLALTNGATFTAAMLTLALIRASDLLLQADIVAAMSLEAMLGVSDAFDARLHQARRHPGQQSVAERIRLLTQSSEMLDGGPQVQDAYSLRCIPQVHGPAEELLGYVAEIVQRELNAATDNPLLFDGDVLSGGNFHGEPLALAADYLKLPLAEIGALAERRLFRLTSSHTSFGLSPMLVADETRAGLDSGLMMLQYTAASLVLENQHAAAPDSVLSLPTSAGQEDLNANATTAARHLTQVLENLERVLAIEWIAAGQALELRQTQHPERSLGEGTSIGLKLLRSRVPWIERDRPLHAFIDSASALLQQAELLQAVETGIGRLPTGWRPDHQP